jgi:hypothetical protein
MTKKECSERAFDHYINDEIIYPAWYNNKTGKEYIALAYVENATNNAAGTPMVLYRDSVNGTLYVRDKHEFAEKFSHMVLCG